MIIKFQMNDPERIGKRDYGGGEHRSNCWVRERVWGEKTRTGHLGADVEMQCNENILESLRVTLAWTPSNGGYGVQ